MKRIVCLLAILMAVTACDKGESSAETASAADPQQQVDDAIEEVAEAAMFDKDMRKKACEILTPEMVAKAFDVPAKELQQVKVMGCNYGWDNETETLDVRFGSIRVHKSPEIASTWFGNATKDMTAEDTREAMAKITKEAKKDERIDTETKKKNTEKVGGIMGEMGAFDFEDVEGIGDEARENVDDGELWIRLGNMTFIVRAYKGPKQPTPKIKMEPGKTKEYMREIQKLNKEWTRKTIKQRREAGRKIANLVIDKL